jgi:O-antigen ligase
MPSEIDYETGNPIDRTFLTALMAIGILILWRRKIDWAKIIKRNRWILLLFLYMGASIIWSSFQYVSFKRWLRALGDCLMVLIILTDKDPFEAIKKVLRNFATILLPLSVVLIKYYRNIGVAYDDLGMTMWIGVTSHKNSIGQLSCVCAIYYLWNIKAKWPKIKLLMEIALLLFALWLLKGPSSSAGAVSASARYVFTIGICIIVLLLYAKLKPHYIGLCVIFLLFIFMVFQDPLLNLASHLAGRDTTLTGRTDLWKELIKIGTENPIFGVGYGGFWIGNLGHNLWQTFGWKPGQGHNGFIDVYVELGILGIVILAFVILATYKNILKSFKVNYEYGTFRMIFYFVILFYNSTESSFTKPSSFLWFLFLLLAIEIPTSILETQQHDTKIL